MQPPHHAEAKETQDQIAGEYFVGRESPMRSWEKVKAVRRLGVRLLITAGL